MYSNVLNPCVYPHPGIYMSPAFIWISMVVSAKSKCHALNGMWHYRTVFKETCNSNYICFLAISYYSVVNL